MANARSPPGWPASATNGWIALLNRIRPYALREHPDLYWLSPPSDKNTIGIEQVRELAGELALTSHAGGGKMAVIEPADTMTHSAANGLLKTLEEPAGDTLLVLLADRNGALPATIVSRCQRLDVPVPAHDLALRWLNQTARNEDWAELLRLVGGAPIAALSARGELQEARSMAGEFSALAAGRASPIDVAARWSKLNTAFVLDWLARTMQAVIRQQLAVAEDTAARPLPENVLTRMDRRDLFCYLDTVGALQRQPVGSFNPQLAFESLLIDWAGGLRDYRLNLGSGGSLAGSSGRLEPSLWQILKTKRHGETRTTDADDQGQKRPVSGVYAVRQQRWFVHPNQQFLPTWRRGLHAPQFDG